MPQIPEYTAQAPGIAAPETGIEATAQAARRLGSFYHQTGQELSGAISGAAEQAQKYVDHQQISHASLGLAGLTAKWTDDLNTTVKNSDPNDPTVAQRFMQRLEPDLEKFSQGVTSEAAQHWAQSRVDQLREHFMTHMQAEMSTRSAQATAVNLQRVQDTYSNVVDMDPAGLDHALKQFEESVRAQVAAAPNLTGTQAGQVTDHVMFQGKRAIVQAAVQSAIMKNPEAGMALARKYPEYVDTRELRQFEQQSIQSTRLARAEVRAQREDSERQATQDINQRYLDLMAKTAPKTPGDTPHVMPGYFDTLRELVNHPGAKLHPQAYEGMIKLGEQMADKENEPDPPAQTSRQTYMDLSRKIAHHEITSEDQIWDQSSKLTKSDLNSLRSEFYQTKSPDGDSLVRDRNEFFKRYARTVDPGYSMGEHSAAGDQMMYFAAQEAKRREDDLRKKGEDPHSLYSPDSKNYLGTPEFLSKYQITMKDIMDHLKGTGKEGAAEPIRMPPGQNLTGPGQTVTGVEIQNIPPGMSPEEAMKKFKSGTKVRLPDGRTGTVP